MSKIKIKEKSKVYWLQKSKRLPNNWFTKIFVRPSKIKIKFGPASGEKYVEIKGNCFFYEDELEALLSLLKKENSE